MLYLKAQIKSARTNSKEAMQKIAAKTVVKALFGSSEPNKFPTWTMKS